MIHRGERYPQCLPCSRVWGWLSPTMPTSVYPLGCTVQARGSRVPTPEPASQQPGHRAAPVTLPALTPVLTHASSRWGGGLMGPRPQAHLLHPGPPRGGRGGHCVLHLHYPPQASPAEHTHAPGAGREEAQGSPGTSIS